ncbi:MAG TPA: DEAD/DEAH box helicase [Gammaproteobacteria bacterium]|nr:DEAD/DEAH box helicase [Gammaproteobacteria bacterium]
MTFEQLNLNSQITKALAICGYTKPTPIQAKSIPEILLGKDMVASAQTGTGKTAAFVLPALHRLATIRKTGSTPRVLILTPTRELAVQITEAVAKYGKFLRCNIVSLVGGMPYRQQLRGLARTIDIIVATPGRLMDHMSNNRLNLSDIEMLILDEADRMLDMGFINDVKNIASAMPKSRQTLLFSATVDSRLTQIIQQFLKDPVRIEIETEKMAPAKISQELYLADNPQHKMKLLMHLVKNHKIFKGIIFSGTKINADRLADELDAQGFAAAPLHGDLKQSLRTRTLEQLRRGKIQFLVATDVAARGIDIQDITHVINFDLPKFSEDYIHRIGRTGRAGRDGIAISLALPSDGRHIQRIERILRQTLERKTVEGLEPKKQLTNSNRPGQNRGQGRGKPMPQNKKKYHSKKRNERSARPSTERSARSSAERSTRPSTERSARSSADRSTRSSAERSTRSSAERSTRSSADRSTRSSTERRARSSAERNARSSKEGRNDRFVSKKPFHHKQNGKPQHKKRD